MPDLYVDFDDCDHAQIIGLGDGFSWYRCLLCGAKKLAREDDWERDPCMESFLSRSS